MKPILPAQETIAALLPRYASTGDSTVILTNDGQLHSTGLRLRSVINRLARTRSIDLKALKCNCRRSTQRSILQPLPLSSELLLVPIKVRTPRIPGDPCIGYVNYYAVAKVAVQPGNPACSAITLHQGQTVQSLWSTDTVNRYLQLSRLTACSASPASGFALRETAAAYNPELLGIAHKLVEVFHEILQLRQR